MDLSTAIALVGGPFLSLVIAYILGQHYRKPFATGLSFAVCALYALADTIVEHHLVLGPTPDPGAWVQLVLTNGFVVLGAAYTTYEHVLKPSGAAAFLNRIGPQVAARPQPTASAPVAAAVSVPAPSPLPTPPLVVIVTAGSAEAGHYLPPIPDPAPAPAPPAPVAPAIPPDDARARGYSPPPPLP